MGKTSIEWTDFSVNPIRFKRGHFCQKISPGCANCYASRYQKRVANPDFGGVSSPLPSLAADTKDGLWLDFSKLHDVLLRKTPTRYFWCDMTDLFGHWVPDEWIDLCLCVMALTPQHTHQVLTKRAGRLQSHLLTVKRKYLIAAQAMVVSNSLAALSKSYQARIKLDHFVQCFDRPGPFPNIWFGVSAEDQPRWDERVTLLRHTPAAVRFVSVEPLLSAIDTRGRCDCLVEAQEGRGNHAPNCAATRLGIDWVIVGGESGPGARPMHPAWARSIRDQCDAAGVPFFFKQWGDWVDLEQSQHCRAARDRGHNPGFCPIGLDGRPVPNAADRSRGDVTVYRFGKKAAGDLLDGSRYHAFPAPRAT